MKKKLLSLIIALAMLLCALPSYAYSVRDAYNDFNAQYPEFVENVLAHGDETVTESLIIDFLGALQRNLNNKHRFNGPVTEENFSDNLADAVLTVSSGEKYTSLQLALYDAYPDAAYEAAVTGKISGELMPIYEAVKSMIFDHNMLEVIDTNIDNTIEIVSADPIIESISVIEGGTFELPKTITTHTETNRTVVLDIEWTNVPETTTKGNYTAEGNIVVPNGFVLAIDGTVSVAVTVIGNDKTIEITGIDALKEITVDKGDNLELPKFVNAKTSEGETIQLEVKWNNIPQTNKTGTFTAEGTIASPEGFELKIDSAVSVSVTVKTTTGSTGIKKDPVISGPVVTGPTETTPIVHKYSFTDVTEATEAGKAIYALTDAGVLTGYPDKTFKPSLPVTRAEFVTMMVRALDILDVNATSAFNDVASSEWYYAHVSSAVKNGLVNGYEDNTFRPSGNITRAEAMAVLYRTLDGKKLLTAAASTAKFADEASIPAWASSYVHGLFDNKIVAVNADNKIRAEVNATREECAVMIYNTLKTMGKIK